MTKQNIGARHAPSTFSEADWRAGFEEMGSDPETNAEFAIHAAYEVIFSEATSPEAPPVSAGTDMPRSGG